MEMLAGGALLFLVGLAAGELGHLHLTAITPASWWAFGYLVLVGALVGYSAYIWLLHNVSSTAASTYAYVNPLVAVILGAAVLGERVSWLTVVAGGMILVAVALILASRRRAQPSVRRDLQPQIRDVA